MKIIKNMLIVIYAIIAIFATVCLISINDYRVTELGEYSLLYVDKYTRTDKFDKGDLAIVSSDYEIKVGDEIFFYSAYDKNIRPTAAKVVAEETINPKESTYSLDNDHELSSQFVIGKVEDATRIPVAGGILSIIQSKWGFLFLIVLPVLIAFIYEIYSIILEIKSNKTENSSNTNSQS